MPDETPTVSPTHDPGPGQTLRRACAVLIGLAAWWLFPILFPYFDLEHYLERILRSTPEWIVLAPLGGFVPPLVLGLGAYSFFPLRPTSAVEAETGNPSTGRQRWLPSLLVVLMIGGSLLLAHLNRFLDDDAFISFRYARNLVEGHGLVYNPGERVEGYTNFFWVLLVAAGLKLGLDPAKFAQTVGMCCLAGTLALTWQTARRLLPGSIWALAAVLLVGTNHSVLAFATCGLETALVTVLLAAGCSIVSSAHGRGSWRPIDLLSLSGICAVGILTRMDFVVFAAVLSTSALVLDHRSRTVGTAGTAPVAPFRHLVFLFAPAALIVGLWFAWKWSYYGAIMPNTYYAKRPGAGAAALGLQYLADFGRSYRYWLPAAVTLIGVAMMIRRRHAAIVLLVVVLAWLVYVVVIGGDFMEFRFIVPIVPALMILLVWTLANLKWAQRIFLPAFVALWTTHGSLAHLRTYGWMEDRAEPVSHLRWQTTGAHWAEAGRALHDLFGGTDVVIATTCAGILPYYARLQTLDMHGLADSHVALHGRWLQNRPGHKRIANEAYMRERGVNLVIGHPIIEPLDSLEEISLSRLEKCAQGGDAGTEAHILAIPISGREALMTWYLTPHPAIEQAMEQGGWRLFSVTLPRAGEGP